MPSFNVALITAGPHIRAVTNYKQVRARERQKDPVITSFVRYKLTVKLLNCLSSHCLSYWQPRFRKYLRSLKLRSNRPAFWRRNFLTLPSSTLLSSHLIHKHMQVSYLENKNVVVFLNKHSSFFLFFYLYFLKHILFYFLKFGERKCTTDCSCIIQLHLQQFFDASLTVGCIVLPSCGQEAETRFLRISQLWRLTEVLCAFSDGGNGWWPCFYL